LELLKQSVEDGAKFYNSNVFENDPTLQPLKNDPDFKKVIFPYN